MRIQRLKTKAFNFIEQVTDVYLVTSVHECNSRFKVMKFLCFQVGDEDNQALEPIINAMKAVQDPGKLNNKHAFFVYAVEWAENEVHMYLLTQQTISKNENQIDKKCTVNKLLVVTTLFYNLPKINWFRVTNLGNQYVEYLKKLNTRNILSTG